MEDEDVTWGSPGRKGRGPGPLFFRLLKLMKRPGEWAIIGRYANVHSACSTASRLKDRRTRRLDGDFEFTARTDASGRGLLYARFVPAEMNLP